MIRTVLGVGLFVLSVPIFATQSTAEQIERRAEYTAALVRELLKTGGKATTT